MVTGQRLWWVGLGALTLVVGDLALHHSFWSGDSHLVASSGAAVVACVRAGTWVGCPGVPHFPPLQLAIAAAGAAQGFTPDENYRLLGKVNLAAWLVLLGLTWGFFRTTNRPRAFLALASLVGGYAVNYAVTSFGELLGVVLGAWLVLSAQRARVGQATLAVTLLCLTKDFAAPLALALGVAALPTVAGEGWADWLRRTWRPTLALATGALVGGALSVAFNVFRYGTLTNTYLLDEKLRTHTAGQFLVHLAALFVAPAGGLLVVAPLSVLVVGLAVGAPWQAWRRPAAAQRWAPLVFTLLVSVGLANWFTPLGWWAWGARLSLPWLVPAVLLALAVAPPGSLERGRWWLWALSPLAVLNACHLALPEPLFRYFEAHRCPPDIGSAGFYACNDAMMFDLRGGLTAQVLRSLAEPRVAAIAALHLVVVLGALALWSRPRAPP